MIIAVLEGSGGAGILGSAIGASIPEVISVFNSTAQETDTSYKDSMRCPDITATSILDVFKSKSVDEDSHLSGALQKFKNEVARLEQAIRDLEAQINSLTNTVNELTSKINMYNIEQSDCKRIMANCAFEMNHFKPYM